MESLTRILKKIQPWQIVISSARTHFNKEWFMTKALLLTNDSSFRRYVNLTLSCSGFIVHCVSDSAAAWKFLKEVRFDFIMIDYQLSEESGLAFYKSLRQFGTNIPVLMVGEGAFDEFMLKDLSPHNYDYLLKPFKFDLLRTKITKLLQMDEASERLVSFGDLKIDVRQQLVMVKDRFIQLGKMEMKVLMLLAKKTGEVVAPGKIKSILESEENLYNMTPFYYVSKLRNKLKTFAGEAFDICLIGNEGYRLEFRT